MSTKRVTNNFSLVSCCIFIYDETFQKRVSYQFYIFKCIHLSHYGLLTLCTNFSNQPSLLRDQKCIYLWDAWVVQLVEHLTPEFSLGHGPRVMGSSPTLGSVLCMEPAWDSLSLCPFPICTCTRTVSLKLKKIMYLYFLIKFLFSFFNAQIFDLLYLLVFKGLLTV